MRGDIGPHVIETAIGRIGVGICAENYYCFAASQMPKQSVDVVLMPHAAADMTEGGGLPTVPGTHLASWYAGKLGVPVAMVNKVGRSYKPPPNEIKGRYPGLPNVTDGFNGGAPDLGALEIGQAPPYYGPRLRQSQR
jgi:N-carbamoylputrescine amidase